MYLLNCRIQWQIQGRGPSVFLNQTEAPEETAPPPRLISRSGSANGIINFTVESRFYNLLQGNGNRFEQSGDKKQ